MNAIKDPIGSFRNIRDEDLARMETLRAQAEQAGRELFEFLAARSPREQAAATCVALDAHRRVCKFMLWDLKFHDFRQTRRARSQI